MKRLAVLLVLCGSSAPAFAEDRIAITVRVGETVTSEVGYAMGFFCDDEKVVRGEMRNKDADNNVFAVTGLEVGTTLCRVGTVNVENRPTYLFEVTVTKAASGSGSKAKPNPRRAAPTRSRRSSSRVPKEYAGMRAPELWLPADRSRPPGPSGSPS